MSDTVSDLASRAQAREEVAELLAGELDEELGGLLDDDQLDVVTGNVADALLADFARLAGLLGYVKADGEEFRTFEDGWVGATVRPDGSSEIRSNPATRQRRLVGPWEVVTDAEQG